MLKNTDIIICKAGKGNVFEIMDKENYKSKMNAILSNEDKFLKIDHDSSENWKKFLDEQISNIY